MNSQMREAARYKIDTTRSRGELLVGEGVREEAYKQVRALVEDMEPPQLPGVLDVEDHAVAPSRAVGCREQHFQRFLQETTGMDALEEVAAPLSVGEAQEKAINSFGRRDDNGRVR
ncbi:hypothetical protein, unlikely [Trypanosoma congolense IL3000]|uniref:Uncharacterized protein n=1 Tax=Trypanosoma congolense (strain IL3000) TaxID=1068625 RepID=F9W6T4_TRYCI|nr:hypothetical protein, unlikely [Trypanosoma congolense IL3000]